MWLRQKSPGAVPGGRPPLRATHAACRPSSPSTHRAPAKARCSTHTDQALTVMAKTPAASSSLRAFFMAQGRHASRLRQARSRPPAAPQRGLRRPVPRARLCLSRRSCLRWSIFSWALRFVWPEESDQNHHDAVSANGTSIHHQDIAANGATSKYFSASKTRETASRYIIISRKRYERLIGLVGSIDLGQSCMSARVTTMPACISQVVTTVKPSIGITDEAHPDPFCHGAVGRARRNG